jgi:trimeric autotransporter adhesin
MKTVLSTLALGMIALMLALPASAQPADVKKLEAEVTTLQGQVAALQGQNSILKGQVASLQTTLNGTNAKNALALGQFVTVDTTDTINGLAAPHIIFTGANLHVRDGSGSTNDSGGATTGLGNLVIGYDEAPGSPPAGYRSGSHDLVVGPGHTFNSFGGFVAGDTNAIEGPSASVSGGHANAATGLESSVSGGVGNGATDFGSSVSGGHSNAAVAFGASVSGGNNNVASSGTASVSGGGNNQASAADASVSGGEGNTASEAGASISGGILNQATGFEASVSGGSSETASGDNSTVGGGASGQNASGTNQFLP